MKNIEDYGFDHSDLIIATSVNSYLKNLMPEARREALDRIVRQEGAETVINGPALATLIESAKAAAMIGSQDWEDGDDVMASRPGQSHLKSTPKCKGW